MNNLNQHLINSLLGYTQSEQKDSFDKKFSQYKKDIKQMENIVKKQRETFYKENKQFKRR